MLSKKEKRLGKEYLRGENSLLEAVMKYHCYKYIANTYTFLCANLFEGCVIMFKTLLKLLGVL